VTACKQQKITKSDARAVEYGLSSCYLDIRNSLYTGFLKVIQCVTGYGYFDVTNGAQHKNNNLNLVHYRLMLVIVIRFEFP